MTFDCAVVTLTYKILSGLYLGNRRKLLLFREIAMSWCDLDLTFDLVIVTMSFKIFSGLFL